VSFEFDDYEVPWMSEEACEKSAATLRKILGMGKGRLPPIMNVLESARRNVPEAKDFELIVLADESMGRADAYAKFDDREIFVKQSIVEAALGDNDAARDVLLHELNHLIFHRGPPKFRIANGNQTPAFIDKHNSAEWQADRITRALFMPPEMVDAAASPLDLARTAGVPLKAALSRIADLQAGQSKVIPLDIQRKLADRELGAQSSNCFANRTTQSDAEKLKLWNELLAIEGKDPGESRMCGTYWIDWNEFERTTECGWFINGGQIVSSFKMRHG